MSGATTPKGHAAKPAQAMVWNYAVGFVLSVLLTLAAYIMVTHHLYSGFGLAVAVTGLAVVQLLVQLLFFLHLRDETEPRWRLLMLDFAVLVVVIVALGSLWIMGNLDYNMTHSTTPTGDNMDQQLLREEGIPRRVR